ncbi:MAG TPA: hypothetical protein VK587_09200 [bacterium]|nr:hypothetical protein [bacterium]
MKAIIAIALSLMLPLLGLNGVASAQSTVAVRGTIATVDCQSGTVVVNTASGQQRFDASNDSYASVDATNLPFCSLEGYVGAPATVWLTASGDQLLATAVNVTGPVAVAPVAAQVVSPLPVWGTVLGTVVVTGLLYLAVYAPDGHYYRYPYYGGYYRYYYHAGYRRYTGFYPASAAIITVALPIVGIVLGTVTVDGNPYLVSRDPAGHVYRYPYWGPYRQHYYRPAYRPYAGANVRTYVSAAVRQGDPHWDAPAHMMAAELHRLPAHGVPQHQAQPAYRQPTNPPAHQPQPAYRQPTNPPAHQPQPAYRQPTNAPAHQPQPAYRQPTNPPAHQPQPAYRQPINPPAHQPQQNSRQQCGNQQGQSNQSCQNRGK